MSTDIIGIKPADEKWKQMKAIWDACKTAKIQVPAEVEKFFGWADPEDQGVIVDIRNSNAVQKVNEDGECGFLVDLNKLSPDVKFIKFTNSW